MGICCFEEYLQNLNLIINFIYGMASSVVFHHCVALKYVPQNTSLKMSIGLCSISYFTYVFSIVYSLLHCILVISGVVEQIQTMVDLCVFY